MNKTIRIPFSKKRTYIALIGVITVLGAIVNYLDLIKQYLLDTNNLRIFLYAGISLLMVIGFFFFIIYRLFKPRMSLVLDPVGFTDQSNYANLGRIKWGDISEIKQVDDFNNDLLLIFVKNPEEYLNNVNNRFSLKLLEKNQEIYGTCFLINIKAFQFNSIELIKLIKEQYRLYKSKNRF